VAFWDKKSGLFSGRLPSQVFGFWQATSSKLVNEFHRLFHDVKAFVNAPRRALGNRSK
jgi:hypothetical protein